MSGPSTEYLSRHPIYEIIQVSDTRSVSVPGANHSVAIHRPTLRPRPFILFEIQLLNLFSLRFSFVFIAFITSLFFLSLGS